MKVRKFGSVLAAGALLVALATPGARAQQLSDSMIWSTYGIGSTGYTEATAIADALSKRFDVRVRLLPSDTTIGRMLALKSGRADYGWLATSVLFGVHGDYEFAQRDWGPQDLRVLAGRPAAYGWVTTQKTGIDKLTDIKGKRIAFITANNSINSKNEALVAAAGLTLDDVEIVEFPSYSGTLDALKLGQVDIAGAVPTTSGLHEVEASPSGLKWVNLDPDNPKIWSALSKISPGFSPIQVERGIGISAEHPVDLLGYRYPMITVYASADPDKVYAFLKAFAEVYPDFKDATAAMHMWDLSKSGQTPQDAPFHEGAVRYYKEIGAWTPTDEAWNEKRLATLGKLQKAWTEVKKQEADADDETFAKAWAKRRDAVLAGD